MPTPAISLLLTAASLGQSFAAIPGPDAAALLSIPAVHSVSVHRPRCHPTRRIIHIRDWHFVAREDFAAELSGAEEGSLSKDDLEPRYEEFLAEVEAVQAEQRALLRHLIKRHGITSVHIEGLSSENMPAFLQRIRALRNFEKHKPQGYTPIEQLLLIEYRLDRLQIGAAAQLFLSGALQNLRPAENPKLYSAADPVMADGTLAFDEWRNAAREDAIVRELLAAGPVSLIVLGGDHDFADNAHRISCGTCEVLTVTLKAYRSVAE